MCYKLKEKSNYLTMGTDSGQMRQHATDDCMGDQMKTDWNLQTGEGQMQIEFWVHA